jgi:peptidoglycan/xylan/chitin deacetylase (PgdA/CDA1 family)
MWLLKILGYQGLSMRDLLPYLEGEKKGKVVGITLDDGFQNNLQNAVPILRKYNFTATCYIVSEQLGKTNSWDEKHGIPQKPLMNIKEIKEWLASGMDIGVHTANHINLVEVDIEIAKQEIESCKKKVENIFDCRIDDFCYPFGRVNEKNDKFTLYRVPVNYQTLPHLFLLKLLTGYEDRRTNR